MLTEIIFLAILILLNAYFAATEIAFISLNDTKIEKMSKEGDKKAIQIVKMLKNPSKFLATIQIGITLAGFLSSAFASDTFADVLAPLLNRLFPLLSIEIWRGISIFIITIILSYFTLVFGELVPKRIAMKYYEKIAFFSIKIISVIATVTAPFVALLTMSTNIVSKVFGVSENEEAIVTEEEIKMMVDEGEEKGTIDEEEREMINNVFEFNDITAAEVMTHRRDMFALEIEEDLYKVLDEIDEYKYSRIPIYEENVDNIKGILYIKDILRALRDNEEIKTKQLIKDAYFVPETKPINEIFKELQKNKKQIAIVVDEYGGTSGLLTMEDILEELVGNIFDEYDEIESEYEKIDEDTYLISGSISIYDVRKILGVHIPEGDYDTLSGYILEELGRLPEDGEKPVIETKDMTYKVESIEDKRIMWVKVCKNNNHNISEDTKEEK